MRLHDPVHGAGQQRQLEAQLAELEADVDVVDVPRPPAGDDRDVVEAVRPTTLLPAPDLDFHGDLPI